MGVNSYCTGVKAAFTLRKKSAIYCASWTEEPLFQALLVLPVHFRACSISTVSKVLSILHSRFIFTMHSHSCSKSVWEPYLSELLLPSPNITHISSNGSCWKIKAFLSKFSSQTGTFCVTLCCLFFSPTPLGVIN